MGLKNGIGIHTIKFNGRSHIKTDYVGKKFGYIEVIAITNERLHTEIIYNCKCVCGVEFKTTRRHLRNKKVTSCGCKQYVFKPENLTTEPGVQGLKRVFRTYRKHAKSRNLEFEINLSQFKEITQQNCTYCNIEPHQISKEHDRDDMHKERIAHNTYIYNGIDRKNSRIGYVHYNLTPCCNTCNRIKGNNLSYEQMIEVGKLIKNWRKDGLLVKQS